MRIAFDQQVFLLQEYGGISRYVCNLGTHLALRPDLSVRIVAPLHFNGHLEALPKGLPWGWRVPSIPKAFRLICATSEALARPMMRAFRPDIVHETYYSHAGFAPRRSRRVVTVYDMIHEKFASTFSNSHLTSEPKKAATMRADHVICISESTRRDLIEIFGVPEDKVSVVHLGYHELLPSGKMTADMLPDPYLLYVGGRSGYKNFSGLLRAVANSSALKNDFSIVCFGGGPLGPDELSLIRELGFPEGRIRQFGGGDDVLADLYQNATAFVCPSLYEGFGIPTLEAMSLDCPVVSSNTSSLPEVVGDAGEYFDPNDLDSMRAAIEAVVLSPDRSCELVESGRKRCASFSWTRCASETLAVYRSLM